VASLPTSQPITDDDEALQRALADAHLPSILPALAQLTGDLSLLRPNLVPNASPFARDQGGYTEGQMDEVRALALDALRAYRDGGSQPAPPPSDHALRALIAFITANQANDQYVPLLLEELALPATDARAPQWHKGQIAPGRPFLAAIIGAGMSGILAGIRLKQAGVPFVIVEKNPDFGGTWFENTYPGARVDNPNHGYSYSFAQKSDWPFHFSTQDVLLDYFRGCAEEHGLRNFVRFGTEVVSMAFNDEQATWAVRVRMADGHEETIEANAVISAVGQLNRPKMPDIAGQSAFEGPSFHSARWDHGIDLRGKRVAVIGTGASASQFIPHVAEQVAQLSIFQRTPNWYGNNPNYHAAVAAGLQWLFAHVPHYAQWYRFWIFWTSTDGLLAMVKVDPDWDGGPQAVSAENDRLRRMFASSMEQQLADRPDLLAKVIPNYPPASKRIVVDNGIWPATLKRPNVELITSAIGEITPQGVRTVDGDEHAADVIIYGTGFQASHFLTPMHVTGLGGRDLHAAWEGDARAYLGITVPGFPNFFLMYGPNTNIVVNGSIIYFSECEMTYILGCLRVLFERSERALDCRAPVYDAYCERIDAGNRQMAWGVGKVNSWYRNEKGRVTQNWPFSLLEYWQQTQAPNVDDYVLL